MGKPPLRYIADSNEINDAPTPSGFLISPQEAYHIVALRHFVGKRARHFYHDGENYYTVYNRSTDAHARKHGTIINGRTGQIYDRKSKSWEADPRQTNSTSADDAVALKRALQGNWEVVSASYQTTGLILYTFVGDTLTIESRLSQEKRSDSPREVYVSKWSIEIDSTPTPSRLIMTRLDRPETRTEAFQLRNGELWMCRDFGRPITLDSLQSGTGGWVTGLRRVR